MRAWKRWRATAVRSVLVLSMVMGLAGAAAPASLAQPSPQGVLQDWWTIAYGPEESEYVVRLALKSGSISGPLDPSTDDNVLDAMAVYETSSGQRVDDVELERKIVFLAQNQALMEANADWKLDPWNIEAEGTLQTGTDRDDISFTLRQSTQFTGYYGDMLLNWFSETQDFGHRSRLYRDVARMLVLPTLDADKDLAAITKAFNRDFGESFDEAVAQMEPFPNLGTGVEKGQWVAKLLQTFNLIAKGSRYGQAHVGAMNSLGTWLSGAAAVLALWNMGITRSEAIDMAKTVAQVSAQNSYYAELRLEALEQIVQQESWDFAAEWGLTLLRTELNNVQAGDVQEYWQQWLEENTLQQLLTVAGVAMGCAAVAAKAAGVAISSTVGAVFIAVWVGGQAWFFIDEQADTAVSASMALTFEHYIRTHMDDDLTPGCSGNIVERALLLNNLRYRAASLYYTLLYDKYDTFFYNEHISGVPETTVENWPVMRHMYNLRFGLTLPPTYLIRLEAVHEGASGPEEVEAYAGWFVDKIQPLDQFVGPKITEYGVAPEYGSYLQTFRFRARYRAADAAAPAEAQVILEGESHALTLVASETYDSVVYYHTFEYERSGLPVGVYHYHFEIGEAPPTAEQSFEVSSDASLFRPSISIVSPLDGAAVSGRVEIQAWALTGDIQQVRFYVNSHLCGVDSEAPWTCSWDTEGPFNGNGPVELMAVAYDASGQDAADGVTVQVYNPAHNEAPDIEVLAPNGGTAFGRYTIRWEDEDLDDPAIISLYYDSNASGYDGTLIQDYISEEWTTDWWSWDISDLAGGSTWWVYAKIDDGENPPVYDYSPGPVTIATLSPGANFSVEGYELVEGTGSDGDGVPDAGEALEFEITIRNTSAQEWCEVKGILSTGVGGVTIEDNEVSYYSPDPGATSGGRGDFDLSTDPALDANVGFGLRLTYEDCGSGIPYVENETVQVSIRPNDTTTPVIVAGPTVSSIQPDSAVISWTTDEPADSVVEYGLTTAYGSMQTEGGSTTTHRVTVRGLTGGYEHYFRVNSTDPSGNGPTQAPGSFTTTNLGAGYQAEEVIYGQFDTQAGLAWDGTHLWVLSSVGYYAYRVHEYDPVAKETVSWFDVDFFPDPRQHAEGLAWDGSHLWIGESSDELVYRVTTTGEVVTQLDPGIEDVNGLAWGNGYVWVSDTQLDKIYQLTTAGVVVKSFDAPGLSTRDLGWSGGHLWALDSGSDMIYEMDTDGTILGSAPLPELAPKGLAFESASHFWVADDSGSGRLVRYELVEDTTSPLITVAPHTVSSSGSAAVLSWTTDEPADSRIEYGLTTAYGESVVWDLDVVTHTLSIQGLSPNTVYQYRAGSQDLAGNDVTWSGNYTFSTSAQTSYNVRTFFQRPMAWRFEGIAWDGTNLVAYEGGKEHYYTHDVQDGHILHTAVYTIGATSPEDLTWVNGDIWFSDRSSPDRLIRIDGTTGALEKEIVLDSQHDLPAGIAWDGARLWYADVDSDTILKVNPTTGIAESAVPYPPGTHPGGMDYADGYLWYVDAYPGGAVYQLDPADGSVVSTFTPPTENPYGIVWGGGYLWISDDDTDSVYQLDPAPTDSPVVATVLSGNGIGAQGHEFYQVGSTVTIAACEQFARSGLTATVSISSTADSRTIEDAVMTDRGGGCYDYGWNTAGGVTTEPYGVEVRLTDGVYGDDDGLWRTPDLSIRLAHRVSLSNTVVMSKPIMSPWGFAWAGDDMWVNGRREIARYDQAEGQADLTFVPPLDSSGDPDPHGMDWDGSRLWLANNLWYLNGTRHVSRHDYNGNTVGGPIYANDNYQLGALALAGSNLWLADDEVSKICRYPNSGGSATLCFSAPTRVVSGLEWDGSSLWVIDDYNDRVYEYDGSGNEIDGYTCQGCEFASMRGDELWVYTGTSGASNENIVFRSLRWLPDVSPGPLAASKTTVMQGEQTVVTATVYADNGTAEGVTVQFYLGDPDGGGTALGAAQDLGTVVPGSPEMATMAWSTTTVGLHDVYVLVDPVDAVEENQEDNNSEGIEIEVYDPDPDPPVISGVSVAEESGDLDGVIEDNEVIRFTWTVTDALSGVDTTAVIVEGTTYPGAGSYHALVGPLAEGVYAYTIVASDQSDETATWEGEVDVMPHALQVASAWPPPDASGVPPSEQIGAQFETAVVEDSLSGEAFRVMAAGGVTVTGRVDYGAERWATFMPYTELENSATYTATLLAGVDGPVDEYSNTLEAIYEWTFTTKPDTTPPVALLSGPAPDTYYRGRVGVFGTALDKNLGLYRIQHGAGAAPGDWSDAGTHTEAVDDSYLGAWDTTGVADGLHTLRLVVSDTFGLDSLDTLTVLVDNTPPTPPESLYSTSHTTGTWSNEPVVTVAWTAASDGGSGPAGYAVSWDPEPGGQPVPVVELGPEAVITTSPTLEDGDQWFLALMSIDRVGNRTAPSHLGPFYIDSLPPDSRVLPLPAVTQQLSVTVCWEGEDTASGVASYDVWVRDGAAGTWTEWLAGVSGPCADWSGEDGHLYYFESRAQDVAGNGEALAGGDGEAWTEIQTRPIFRVYLPVVLRGYAPAVNRPPHTPADPAPADGASDQSVEVDLGWTGGDPDGDAVTYDVFLSEGGGGGSTLVCDDAVGSACDPGALSPGTQYEWQVVARDEHGATTPGPVWTFGTRAGPAVRYVASGGSDAGGCTNPAAPCATVQYAVDRALEGDEIRMADGVYSGASARPVPDGYGSPPASGLITQTVCLTKTVTLRGGYTTGNWTTPDAEANPTTLDAAGQGRVMYIGEGSAPTIEGLRITGGDASALGGDEWGNDVGGGVQIDRGTATFNQNRVWGNHAERGGGLHAWKASATLNDNAVLSNTADSGGGVHGHWSTLTLTGNTLSGNSAGYGGGLSLAYGTASLEGNTIAANSASQHAGGLRVHGSEVSLEANWITANSAPYGGGLVVRYYSEAVMTNTVVADNQASTVGSGVYVERSDARLVHTTLARNGGGDGSGVYVTTDATQYSSVALTNTIVASQTVGIYATSGNTATLAATLWGDGAWDNGADWGGEGTIITGTTNAWGNPAFADPEAGDYHLGPGSAARDAGPDAGVATDIDGETRPEGAGFDLGADEYYPPSSAGWEEVGSGSASGGGISNSSVDSMSPSLAVAPDNRPYVAWHEWGATETQIYLLRWNGSGWAEVGAGSASGGGISNSSDWSWNPAVAIAPDGTPYVAWNHGSGEGEGIYVRRWNGASWEEVGSGSASGLGISGAIGTSAEPSLAIAPDGTPYAVWYGDGTGGLEVFLRRWNGAAWEEVGAGSASGGGISNNAGFSQAASVAVAPDGTPYVTWMDNTSGHDEIYVRRWNGSTWAEVGSGSASGGGISNQARDAAWPVVAVAPDGTPYVAWFDNNGGDIYIRQWDGAAWVEVGAGSASGGGISGNVGYSFSPSLAIAPDGTPTVAWTNVQDGRYEVYVRRWNGSSWAEVGTGSAGGGGISDSTGESYAPSLAIGPDGVPYAAWYEYYSGQAATQIYVRRRVE